MVSFRLRVTFVFFQYGSFLLLVCLKPDCAFLVPQNSLDWRNHFQKPAAQGLVKCQACHSCIGHSTVLKSKLHACKYGFQSLKVYLINPSGSRKKLASDW